MALVEISRADAVLTLTLNRPDRLNALDVAMADGTLWLDAMTVSGVLAGGPEARPGEDPLAGGSTYDYFQTRDGGWLAVGALEPKFWSLFCQAIGRPELEHHPSTALSDLAALRAHVAEALARRDRDTWREVFAQVPCCVEPVLSTREALDSAQVAARELVIDAALPDGGVVRQLALPVRLGSSPTPRAAEIGRAHV